MMNRKNKQTDNLRVYFQCFKMSFQIVNIANFKYGQKKEYNIKNVFYENKIKEE